MTREEEIDKAGLEWFAKVKEYEADVATAFLAGAQWADAHSHWISVEDEMPRDSEYVATINTVGVKDVRYYSRGKWYSNFGNEYDGITHWMPLPKMPILSKSSNTGKDLKGGDNG